MKRPAGIPYKTSTDPERVGFSRAQEYFIFKIRAIGATPNRSFDRFLPFQGGKTGTV
jgi:hypothetical protein